MISVLANPSALPVVTESRRPRRSSTRYTNHPVLAESRRPKRRFLPEIEEGVLSDEISPDVDTFLSMSAFPEGDSSLTTSVACPSPPERRLVFVHVGDQFLGKKKCNVGVPKEIDRRGDPCQLASAQRNKVGEGNHPPKPHPDPSVAKELRSGKRKLPGLRSQSQRPSSPTRSLSENFSARRCFKVTGYLEPRSSSPTAL